MCVCVNTILSCLYIYIMLIFPWCSYMRPFPLYVYTYNHCSLYVHTFPLYVYTFPLYVYTYDFSLYVYDFFPLCLYIRYKYIYICPLAHASDVRSRVVWCTHILHVNMRQHTQSNMRKYTQSLIYTHPTCKYAKIHTFYTYEFDT